MKHLFVLTIPALMASISDTMENQTDNDDSCILQTNYGNYTKYLRRGVLKKQGKPSCKLGKKTGDETFIIFNFLLNLRPLCNVIIKLIEINAIST